MIPREVSEINLYHCLDNIFDVLQLAVCSMNMRCEKSGFA
jgi:hypothetical protein